MSAKPDINSMPRKSIQIFLHPYLFGGGLEDMPNYVEVISPDVTGFNSQIRKHIKNIEHMCSGLNEDHIKYALMNSPMIVYLYSNKKIHGVMACDFDNDALQVDIICANSAKYKHIGTYLMDVANTIATKLGKTMLTLDAVVEAVPFYQRIGFISVHDYKDTVSMQKAVTTNPLQSIANATAYRRSARNKSRGGKRNNRNGKRKSVKCNHAHINNKR